MQEIDILPTWEEFESLFLASELKTVTSNFNVLSEAVKERWGSKVIDHQDYLSEYGYLFTFGVDGGCTLVGVFTEGFPEVLGVDELIDDIDWDNIDVGTPFTIVYNGKQAQCHESGDDDEYYHEGIMALSGLLLEAGLVLKQFVPAGVNSDIVFGLIPLEIWNKGLEKFGLHKLREIFVDFGDPKIFEYLMED